MLPIYLYPLVGPPHALTLQNFRSMGSLGSYLVSSEGYEQAREAK